MQNKYCMYEFKEKKFFPKKLGKHFSFSHLVALLRTHAHISHFFHAVFTILCFPLFSKPSNLRPALTTDPLARHLDNVQSDGCRVCSPLPPSANLNQSHTHKIKHTPPEFERMLGRVGEREAKFC